MADNRIPAAAPRPTTTAPLPAARAVAPPSAPPAPPPPPTPPATSPTDSAVGRSGEAAQRDTMGQVGTQPIADPKTSGADAADLMKEFKPPAADVKKPTAAKAKAQGAMPAAEAAGAAGRGAAATTAAAAGVGNLADGTSVVAKPAEGARLIRALGPASDTAKTLSAIMNIADAVTSSPNTPEEAQARDLKLLQGLSDLAGGLAGLAGELDKLPKEIQTLFKKFGGLASAAASAVTLVEQYKAMMSQPGEVTAVQKATFVAELTNLAGNLAIGFGAFHPPTLAAGKALTLASSAAKLGIFAYENYDVAGPAIRDLGSAQNRTDIFDYWFGGGLKAKTS